MDDVSPYMALYHLGQLLAAYLLALPIGWNRERTARSAGLRTFPLVAIGSCAFMIIGIDIGSDEAMARVVYGIITGIGFIGGGAILKDSGSVHGTATAASIWSTGAIGVAVAFARWDLAIALCVFNVITFQYVYRLKAHLQSPDAREDDQQRQREAAADEAREDAKRRDGAGRSREDKSDIAATDGPDDVRAKGAGRK